MTDAPRMAVIIPCYNDGATLEETVSSVAGEPVELVVVNDGSDDPATTAVLGLLEAAGVRVIHQPNRGLPEARMTGLSATTAPYVFPLDADDLVEPGSLGALADALDRNPHATVAWGDSRSFGDVNLHKRSATTLDPWQLTYLNMLPVSSLFRREALLAVGGWRQMGHMGYEDWDLWMALAERGDVGIHLQRVALVHRVSGGRMWAAALRHHASLYADLRRFHAPLFAARRRNWRRSRAPWRLRLLLPLVSRVPMPEVKRMQVYSFIRDPRTVLSSRAQRIGHKVRRLLRTVE